MAILAKWKQILSAIFVEGHSRNLTGWKFKLFISIGFIMSAYQVWSVSM